MTAREQMPRTGLQATRPVKRSFSLAGHRTSISLEAAFWDALRAAAEEKGLPLAALVVQIDQERGNAGLSGAVRVWVLDHYRRKALAAAGDSHIADSNPVMSTGRPVATADR